jgi:hypothetical protein
MRKYIVEGSGPMWSDAPEAATVRGFESRLFHCSDGTMTRVRVRPTERRKYHVSEYDRAALIAWTKMGRPASALSLEASFSGDGGATYCGLPYDDE